MPTAQAGLAAQCDAKTVCSHQLPNLYPNAKIHEENLWSSLAWFLQKRMAFQMQSHEFIEKQIQHRLMLDMRDAKI